MTVRSSTQGGPSSAADHARAAADNDEGLARLARGERAAAAALFARALAADAGLMAANVNLGLLRCEAGETEEAERLFAVAARGRPSAAMLYRMGSALWRAGRSAGALAYFNDALLLDPAHVDAQLSLGAMLLESGRLEAAERRLVRVLEAAPDYPEAHISYAIARLLQGDFETGWRHYERRLERRGLDIEPPGAAKWAGEDIAGRTVLVLCEQGFGDSLQFVRYAPRLAAMGARVVLSAPPALARLLRRSFPGFHVIEDGASAPPCDVYVPLMSLPGLFGADLSNIPGEIPYLRAPPAAALAWRRRLEGAAGLKVGVCWRGDRRNDTNWKRSISVTEMAEIVRAPGLTVVSLQKDATSAEIAAFATPVLNAGPELADFADTAGLIESLDVVISVCTATCHLAGALGARTLTALCAGADWRWFLKRTDSPFYPTMRLFRQRALGDWRPVVRELRGALQVLAAPAPAMARGMEPR
jgi:Tfp pilus assembly protein PilF